MAGHKAAGEDGNLLLSTFLGFAPIYIPVIWCFTLVVIATNCRAQPQHHDQEQPAPQPQEVEIIKQINRVNDDGSYTFGYEAADGSFKIETRDVMGNVKGMFGFIDETGELKRVSYTANNGTGLRTSGDINNAGDKPVELPGYTTISPAEEGTRRPLLVLRHPDPSRRPVIQHIPRRQPYLAASSTTTPSYGEYVKGRRTHIVLPNRSEETTSTTPQVTEESEADEPTQIPLRRLSVTKRPLGKGGNNLRRQLGNEPDAPSGDTADVYTGGAAVPRFIPIQSVRSPQSPLLANLPPHVAAAIRQQQLARAAAALRPYQSPDTLPTSAPVPPLAPAPRSSVVDEQEYPVVRGGRNFLPPVRALYRPAEEDGPPQIPFPMASLRSLRDELMDYILQYLQFRLNGGNPYLMNQYLTQFQNPNINPNFPYQNPVYQGPNPYNPYFFPNPAYSRGPFPPVGFPPAGYPPVGYPGQNFPQPLPFSSPNKQQAAQQYGTSQRSAPTYEQFRPSQRFYPPQRIAPAGYETQRVPPGYEQAETRGSSDQTMYTLPPADVLRMMLARGLPGGQTSTTATPTSTTAPVRSVQILGAASSLSTTTVLPPAPVDEMEMQA
ncbi:hypothetical protein J6590_059166 [Homalodisca vitripennis]|nr:hypothetical protein J6590_059166 [Homalodisca vitripennis]